LVQKIKSDFIGGHKANRATPWIAAERGYIDAVIQPHETCLLPRKSLKLLRNRQNYGRVLRKTGLIPI
jgi:long-chain acyl-CoA carboxylase carboxyl transferase subunit